MRGTLALIFLAVVMFAYCEAQFNFYGGGERFGSGERYRGNNGNYGNGNYGGSYGGENYGYGSDRGGNGFNGQGGFGGGGRQGHHHGHRRY